MIFIIKIFYEIMSQIIVEVRLKGNFIAVLTSFRIESPIPLLAVHTVGKFYFLFRATTRELKFFFVWVDFLPSVRGSLYLFIDFDAVFIYAVQF